jgi:acetoin utilization deacetylase AcuC-like enzyme
VLYFSHPSSLEHDPSTILEGHPDTPARIEAIQSALQNQDWLGCDRREAPAASEAELRLIHTPEHVESVQRLAANGGGQIDEDTYVNEASYRAAQHAAGGACAMVRALLAGEASAGFCALRPSGHHATPERAMGFCLFNNLAIAAELARRELDVQRTLIVDWDVHHGNGTAEAFRQRDDVLFVSIHQADLYPGTGAIADMGSGAGFRYTINLPVPRGSDGEVWISLLEHVVLPIAEQFSPQLILISAGFDAHIADPLGGCRVDTDSFAQMALHLRELAGRLHVPVGAVLEGGYDLAALADSTLATIAALSSDNDPYSIAPDPIVTPRAAAHIGHYWDL